MDAVQIVVVGLLGIILLIVTYRGFRVTRLKVERVKIHVDEADEKAEWRMTYQHEQPDALMLEYAKSGQQYSHQINYVFTQKGGCYVTISGATLPVKPTE